MKAFFFDRDDTLNLDTGYINNPEDMKLYRNTGDILRYIKFLRYKIFIITNQSGMGRGLIKPLEYREVNCRFLSLAGGYSLVNDILYCPHSPHHDCVCRKPKTLLLQIVKEQYCIDFTKSYFVGDKITDIICGKSLGLKTIHLIGTKDKVKSYTEKDQRYQPDFVIASISEMKDVIKE